ncbi:MAG: hypothetical protein H6633_30765 [Anaerolineales bacterium]|nr:hypothetical protein [Anaerolineales bacterium]
MSDDKKKPSENDIESPVDGPTPDWMKMATSSDSGPSLTDENTPAWLKEIRSGKKVAGAGVETETSDESSGEMSDLERLLAEEGIDLGSVTEERPQGAEGMSARDWMISTSDDELIRRRIGGDTPLEETAMSAPAPSPAMAEASSGPTDEMSDLERLLAEEGIDLGSVTEERPQGAEGMSARDWMISTSDDELIRRRIGADTPLEETAPAPTQDEPKPAAPEEIEDDKMVVEEDLPDWLREIDEEPVSTDEASPTVADDTAVYEEGLPDWLREIDDDEEVELEAESSFTEVSSDVAPAADDELPDWLSGFEEPMESSQPAMAEVKSSDPEDDKMVVEEDLPDWLREVEDQVEELGSIEAATEDDGLVIEEDLPDWLTDIEETDELALDLDTPVAISAMDIAADDEDLPDWLREVQAESVGTESATKTAAPIDLEDDVDLDDEDLPDWLKEVQSEADIAEAASVEQPAVSPIDTEAIDLDDDDLPDWLREVEAEDEAAAPAIDMPVTAAVQADEEALPDWLKEAADEEDLVEPDFSEDDDFVVEEELPDWLSDVDLDEDAFEPSEPSPEEPADVVAEEDLPDWLRETDEAALEEPLTAEELANLPVAEAMGEPLEETPVVTEELPDWLQSDVEIEAEVEEESVVELEPDVSVTESAPLPAETPEMEPAEVTQPEVEAMPVAQTPSPPTRISSSIPDWLKKLREGDREEPVEQEAIVSGAVSMGRPQSEMRTASAVGASSSMDQALHQNLPQDSNKRLELAREARDKGDIQDAIPIYSSLVSGGAHLTSIIEDLQQSIKVYPTNYRLYQVMGDAMMKDGRLQNALEAYRQALSQLAG